MFKTVFLDLDDTILDFKSAEREAICKTLSYFNVVPTDEIICRYSDINQSLWKKFELGQIERSVLLTLRFEMLFEEFGIHADTQKAPEIYIDALSNSYPIIPGAVELLEKLYKKYDLYIVSNGTYTVQKSRIKGCDISKYFKQIFISQEVGFNKPDIKFFEHCFKNIDGFSKEHAIIIGDSVSSDILGGKNAGIATCLFNPDNKPYDIIPDFVVNSLSEIPKILDNN